MKLNTNFKKCNIHLFFKLHIKQLEYRIIKNNNIILLSANLFSLVNIYYLFSFIIYYFYILVFIVRHVRKQILSRVRTSVFCKKKNKVICTYESVKQSSHN